MIEVTNVDLAVLAQKAYDLSAPKGMGYLHYTPEPITYEQAKGLVDHNHRMFPLDLDYVNGRAVKLTVRREKDGRLWLEDTWFDHTMSQYRELLAYVGIEI